MHICVYNNPEDDINDETVSKLVTTAQSAFGKEGLPTPDDVENHILPVSTFITLEEEKDIIGFSATDTLTADEADILYAAGLAVREERQGDGLGKLLRLRGIIHELRHDGQPVATRTQNPVVMNYFIQYFDAYPRRDCETPDAVKQYAASVAEQLDHSAAFEFPVMREAYPASMYDTVPHGPYREYLDSVLDYRQWRCRYPRRIRGRGRVAG